MEAVERARALERAMNRLETREHPVDRLLADRHHDRRVPARLRYRNRVQVLQVDGRRVDVRDREPVALRTSAKKPSSAVQKPIEIQPKSAPKKQTIASSSQVSPRSFFFARPDEVRALTTLDRVLIGTLLTGRGSPN